MAGSLRQRRIWLAAGALVAVLSAWSFYRRPVSRPEAAEPIRFGAPVNSKAFAELGAIHQAVCNNYQVPMRKEDIGRHSYFKSVAPRDANFITAMGEKKGRIFVSMLSRKNIREGWVGWTDPAAQGPFLLSKEGLAHVQQTSKSSSSMPRYGYGGELPDDLPQDGELTDGALGFYQNPPLEPGATWPFGSWDVTFAPIRANSEACLNCHNQYRRKNEALRMGDVVGVAMYSYRQGTF